MEGQPRAVSWGRSWDAEKRWLVARSRALAKKRFLLSKKNLGMDDTISRGVGKGNGQQHAFRVCLCYVTDQHQKRRAIEIECCQVLCMKVMADGLMRWMDGSNRQMGHTHTHTHIRIGRDIWWCTFMNGWMLMPASFPLMNVSLFFFFCLSPRALTQSLL